MPTTLITEIQWETEGQTREECRLPDMVVAVGFPETLEDELGQALVDQFGFKQRGFVKENFFRTERTTHPGGAFFPPNLAVIRWAPVKK